jgi:hypothetical protein
MCGVAVAGWQLMRQRTALESEGRSDAFARRKAATAEFFLTRIVPEALGLAASARAGAAALYAIDSETLTG